MSSILGSDFSDLPLRKNERTNAIHIANCEIVKATAADRKEILRLMVDVFYKTDPSSVYSKVSENPQVSTVIQDMSLESLDEDSSFIAKEKEKSKNVVGVAINGVRPTIARPNYMDSLLKKVKSKNEKTLLELWEFVSTMPPNPEKYFNNTENVFEIRYLVVNPSYRNQGIATALVNHSIKEATSKGHKFIRIDCTSHFTARIASAAGMDCIYEINYEDYKSPSGEYVFQNVIFPHTKILIFAKKNTF